MNNNKNLAYCRCAFIGLLCLLTSQAFAQKRHIIKAITTKPGALAAQSKAVTSAAKAEELARKATQGVQQARATHLSTPSNSEDFTNASGKKINPNAKNHSAYPSGGTVLGSEKVVGSGKVKIPHNVTASNYISAAARRQWVAARELLSSRVEPTAPENLARYLRHPVPAQTFLHIQTQYAELIAKTEAAEKRIMPTVVYASLPGEGVNPRPIDVGIASEIIYPIILQTRELLTALPHDPFLTKQKEAWEATFIAYNPLLASVMASPSETIIRTDNRTLNSKEFNLYNPDGTDYLLPGSESLLEKDLDEYPTYAEERAEMRAVAEIQKNTAAELPALLDALPANLRIAFINDDLLPRINFENWAKHGYLGHGATLETFADGNGFMERVRSGTRYDIVITDLLVPYGGISMMPQLRKMDQNAIVIASSKFDRGEEDPEKLFNLGIDGYLWYTNRLDNGSVGYIEYLRAMKNYFHYKAQHNWQR